MVSRRRIDRKGEHKIAARFHFDAGLNVKPLEENSVVAVDKNSGALLLVRSLDLSSNAELEAQFTSRHYGSRTESLTACWKTTTSFPCKLRWAIIPVCAGDDYIARMNILQGPTSAGPR